LIAQFAPGLFDAACKLWKFGGAKQQHDDGGDNQQLAGPNHGSVFLLVDEGDLRLGGLRLRLKRGPPGTTVVPTVPRLLILSAHGMVAGPIRVN